MSNAIRIKRSKTVAVPTTLAAGELAYSEKDSKKALFIGNVDGNAVTTLCADFGALATTSDVSTAVSGLAVATDVTTEIGNAVSGLAVATDVTTEIGNAVSGLQDAAEVAAIVADATIDGGTF